MPVFVLIDRIRPNPWQTRRIVDETHIRDLAADIRARRESRPDTLGLLQVPAGRVVDAQGRPVTPALPAEGDITPALKDASAFVQLAYGHNRLAAFRLLAEEDPAYRLMPVEIVAFTDEEMATAAWSENAARKDLTPIEEAEAIRRMMDSFGWTQAQVAERLGLSRSAVANKLRLLRLPKKARQSVLEGHMSERQALALLPALDFPDQERARKSYGWRDIQEVLDDPDRFSSEDIRRKVTWFLRGVTKSLTANTPFPPDSSWQEALLSTDGLADRPWVTGEMIEDFLKQVGIRSLRCDCCNFRVRRGQEVLCADPDCYAEKLLVWKRYVLDRASKDTGLPVLDPEEEDRLSYSEHNGFSTNTAWDREALAHALKEKCPNLHVGWRDSGDYYLRPEGHPQVRYVCVHPGKCHCACRKAAERESREAEIAAEKERKRQVREVRDRAVDIVAAALGEGQVGALRAVLVDLAPWTERDKMATITDPGTIIRKIAQLLVRSAIYWPDDPAEARRRIREWLEKMGITASPDASPDPLADIHRRWVRIDSWLGRLYRERPTPAAVRGNLANLDKLADELEKLDGRADGEVVEKLAHDIARAMDTLEALQPVVESWTEEDSEEWEHVSWLWNTTAGSVNFKGHLERVTRPNILRYVLALCIGAEGNKTRAAALERRLRELENGRG